MSNNSQQFQAQFSLNGQQVIDELKRIDKGIEDVDSAMKQLHNDGTAGYKAQMQQYAAQRQALIQQKKEMTTMGKVLKNMVKDLDKASPNQLKQTMRDINKAIDSGAIKRGTRDWKEALKVLSQCDRELKKIKAEQSAIGGSKGKVNMGGLFSGGIAGITKLAGALGVAFTSFQAIGTVITDIIQKNKEFEQANANLASVLGTTRDAIKPLTQEAKMLGSTTQYTASQVTLLQTELAKLGFTSDEISASTKSILSFATATGSELADAASVAGAALRAFGLDAQDMDRVVSTMAVATTKSALDFEKLRTSISIVSPVSKQFGFSIEETVALLGKLSDAGFDASSAATAIRNIMLYMADSSSKLSKALGSPIRSLDELGPAFKKLTDRGIDLAEMLDLTDKRAVSAFATLVSQGDGLVKLRDEITDCNAALDEMVNERMNTLEGSTILLSSAWDGLMLSFSNSTGFMKDVVDLLTDMTNGLTDFFSTAEENADRHISKQVDEEVKRQKKSWHDLAEMYTETGDTTAITSAMTQYDYELSKVLERRAKLSAELKKITSDIDSGNYAVTYNANNPRTLLSKLESRQEELETIISQLDVDTEKYRYLVRSLNTSLSKMNETKTSTGQSDPRQLKIAKLESQAASDRLAVTKDETLSEEQKADKIYAIDKALFEAKRDLYQQDEKEYFAYNKRVLDIEAKHESDLLKRKERQEKEAAKVQRTIESGERAYETAMNKMEEAETRYQGIVAGDESWRTRQQKVLNSLKLQSEAIKRTYETASKKIEEMEQAEMSLASTEEEKTEITDKYGKKREELTEKYNAAIEANTKATNATVAANTKETFERVVDKISSVMEKVADVFSNLSSLIQADYDLQIAKVEARYEAEIEAAEKAGRSTTAIEKQKETEIIAIEKKQAKAQFSMDLAQSFIDSSIASLKVWANPGWPMAIPLQALIAAQHGMTIATLTKQYQTKMASIGQYYDGGYTDGYSNGGFTRYHRPVGVVHDGEFVANHNAVNNPEVRPVLNAIDYAQRTNTASSMTREDLAAAAGFAAGGYTTNPVQMGDSNAPIKRLNGILDNLSRNGVQAWTYVNGRGGINDAQRRATKLQSNAHR